MHLLYFVWADQRRRLFRIDHTVQRAHALTLILITACPRARARAGAKQKEGKILTIAWLFLYCTRNTALGSGSRSSIQHSAAPRAVWSFSTPPLVLYYAYSINNHAITITCCTCDIYHQIHVHVIYFVWVYLLASGSEPT